jgi:hypothetical protein
MPIDTGASKLAGADPAFIPETASASRGRSGNKQADQQMLLGWWLPMIESTVP